MYLSKPCHQWWTEHPAEARDRGIIVSAYANDPALVPLVRHTGEVVLLDDNGGTTPCT